MSKRTKKVFKLAPIGLVVLSVAVFQILAISGSSISRVFAEEPAGEAVVSTEPVPSDAPAQDSPVVSAEPTPVPSEEPAPTQTVEPPAPSDTPEITPEATPTDTSSVTSEPTPSETPQASVEPSAEPTPSASPEPVVSESPSPEPSVEPSIEPTPEPSDSPEPTPLDILLLTPSPSPEVSPEVTPLSTPAIWTDKDDYQPGETVSIFGQFFNSLQNIILKIFGGSQDDGTYTETTQNVTADEQGNFTTTYSLDNIYRPLYNIIAQSTEGTMLADSSFKDSRTVNPPPGTTLNGVSSVIVTPGATISANVNVTTTGSGTDNDWSSTSWRIGTGSFTCVDHSNHTTGANTYNETFNISAPTVPGVYDVEFIAYNNDSCSSGVSATLTMDNAVTVLLYQSENTGTGANVNGPGTIAWNGSPSITAAISADDSNYATAALTTSATSEYLQGTNYGFFIPNDATINGIQVKIMRQSSSNSSGYSIDDSDLYLLKAGVIVSIDHAVTTDWPTSMTEATYGNSSDLWGTTWTPAEINASNFGVALSVVAEYYSRTASVDYIQITVYYTLPAAPTTTVGDGTSPANKSVKGSDANKAVSAFTLATNTGTDTVTGLVVTGTNTDNVAANGVKIYQDNGTTPNEYDAGDTLKGTTSFSGTTATFTGLSLAVTTSATQYLITYDISASPTNGQNLTAAVTGVTATNTVSNNDTTDATLTIDSVAPVLFQVNAVPNPTNHNAPSYTFSSTEAGTITYGGDCSSATTAATASNNNTVTFNTLGDGTHSNCTIRVTDAAGNQSTALNVNSFTIDTTPLTVSINQAVGQTDPTSATPINFLVVFNKSVSTFNGSVVTIGGSAGGAKTATVIPDSGTTFNVAISGMTTAGTVTINLDAGQVTDAAGNGNAAPTIIDNQVTLLDTTPPIITITNPNTNPAQSKTITASTNEGTLTQSITTGSVCDNTLTFVAYTSTTFSSESDNGKKVCYKAVDASNNTTYSMSNAIAGIDRTPPTTSDNAPTAWRNTDASVTLSASDAGGSGVASTKYCTYNSGSPACIPTTTYTAPISVTCPAANICTQIVRYFSTDNATNAETAHDSGTIQIDKIAPGAGGGTVGPKNAGTGTDVTGVGSVIWSNPGNVISDNNSYASSVLLNSSAISHYLESSNYSFSIPAGATINGIQVTIGRYASNIFGITRIQDNVVKLIKAGSVVGTNKAVTGTNWPTAETPITYGGASDLWGTSWTADDIKNSNFGVSLSILNATTMSNSYTGYVDYIQIAVTYSTASVDAGPDKTTNASFTQNGTASDIGSGIATYGWTKDSGPGAISFGTPDAVSTTISADTVGTYVIRFTVTDIAGNSSYDTMTLTWEASLPIVTQDPADQTITYGANAAFSAAASNWSAVQWQVSTNGGSDFSDLGGETNTTLTFTKPGVSMSGNKYRAVFSNTGGSVNTTAATLTVTAKGITITPDAGQNKVYGAAEPTPFTYNNTSLEGSDSFIGALGRVAGSDVNTYAYTLGDLSAGPNYTLAMTASPATFEITPANSVTAVTCTASEVYTGSAIEPCSVLVTGAGGLNLTPAPAYSDNINVGTASASYTYSGDSNHAGSSDSKTFEITLADSVTSVTCPASEVYTGSAIEPCSATVTVAGGLDESVTINYTDNTNFGTAHASATYAGDANHAGSTDAKTFEIAKASSSVVVNCPLADQTYTGSAIEPCTASYSGAGGLSGFLTPTYSDNVIVGTAHASAIYAGDANHEGSSNSATFEIGKADAIITIIPYDVIYDGYAHIADGTAKGVLGEDLVGLDLSATTHTNAGEYYGDAWTFTDVTNNYNNDAGTVDYVGIDKADATIMVTSYNVTYDGDSHAATFTAKGVNNEDLDGMDVSATTHTNAGDYTGDTWSFTDATDNYNDDNGTIDDNIDKASATVVVTPYDVVFDGSSHTATFSAKGVKNEDLAGMDVSGTTHTLAGDYLTDAWTFADVTGNYKNDNGTVYDKIGIAPTTVAIDKPADTQYSDLITLSAKVTPIKLGDETLTGSVEFFISGVSVGSDDIDGSGVATVSNIPNFRAAGNYTVTAEFTSTNANFKDGSDGPKTLTVTQEDTAITYNGDFDVITAGPTITKAPINLSALLTQKDSSEYGDIRLAKVTFVLAPTGGGSSIPIGNIPVNSSDSGVTGTALITANEVPIGDYTISVTISAGNNYWTQNPYGEGILHVEAGTNEQRVTGGGWIADVQSANGKDNFGFTVNYNKNGAPKGNFLFMFRGTDGYNYQVKSNSWAKGGLSFTGVNGATFTAKATIQKIDRLTGIAESLGGSFIFSVNIKDGDLTKPTTPDTLAITIFNPDNSIWKQVGTVASQITLGGGNVTVHK